MLRDPAAAHDGFDAQAFAGLPEEIRLRILMRAIDRCAHEGSAELGKVEALLTALDRAMGQGEGRLKLTLAGAAVTLARGRIHVEPAPPRRRRKA
jgi:tRNA(Ile)-lysidine synthase